MLTVSDLIWYQIQAKQLHLKMHYKKNHMLYNNKDYKNPCSSPVSHSWYCTTVTILSAAYLQVTAVTICSYNCSLSYAVNQIIKNKHKNTTITGLSIHILKTFRKDFFKNILLQGSPFVGQEHYCYCGRNLLSTAPYRMPAASLNQQILALSLFLKGKSIRETTEVKEKSRAVL